MRTVFVLTLLALALVAAVAEEPVDRIVATVNRSVILESEVEEALRAEALIEGRSLSAVTSADLRATLDRLIDQVLLRDEMVSIGIDPPTKNEIKERISQVRRQYPGAADETRWRALLADYGIDEQALEDRIAEQLRVMALLEARLRPNVLIEEEAVTEYYEQSLLPELRRNNAARVPTLPEVETQIREILVQRRIDDLLSAWLHNLRQQAAIEVAGGVPKSIAKVQ